MRGIVKRYYEGQANELEILHGIDLLVAKGEFLSIVGESGSGKSTLMNMIGILDRPTEGSYLLDGQEVSNLTEDERSDIRSRKIGFVFQNFCLISRVSALRNVEMPLMYAGMGRRQRRERAMELLDMVGMADRCSHKPAELSEDRSREWPLPGLWPMIRRFCWRMNLRGALDSATGRLVMDIFHDLHRRQGKTILLITHSRELAEETQRMVTLSDGKILSDASLDRKEGEQNESG